MDGFIHKTCLSLKGHTNRIRIHLGRKFKRESYTFMVVPNTPVKNVKSIRIPRWLVGVFAMFNLAAVVFLCMFFVSYRSIKIELQNQKIEYEALQDMKENDEQHLSEYKSTEDLVRQKIQELQDIEDKLKKIMGSGGSKPQSSNQKSTLASRGTFGSTDGFPVPGSASLKLDSFEDICEAIDLIVGQGDKTIAELNEASLKAELEKKAMMAKPSMFPVSGIITSTFGYRKDPFSRVYDFHTGIDISNKKGTPIRASGDGTVIKAGWDSGYGELVIIDHGNGYESLYGHNSKIVVNTGQDIKRGQVIAYMGSTGRSTGVHCHFEIRFNGKPVDPYSVK